MKSTVLNVKSNSKSSTSGSLPNPVTIAVGLNLKRYRDAAEMTQETLAASAEIERSRISKLENGSINPSLLTLASICHSLGITLPMLFEGISVTMPPMSEGGKPRRSNQATLDKPVEKSPRRHSAVSTKQ